MNSATLRVAKNQLRSLMKQRLANMPKESITSQSKQVFETLSRSKHYVNAKKIAVYLSMPHGELQTDLIVKHALGSGKQVFVPYLHKSGLPAGDGPPRLMDMVSLKDIEDYQSLLPDKWGIPSIDPTTIHQRQRSVGELDGKRSENASLDLILLPGVAFDTDPVSGTVRRLGHGRGFYDYFLHRYALLAASEAEKASNGRPAVLLYALALREQFLPPSSEESVPVGPHDQPIDGVFLGNGVIKESSIHTP